MALAWSFHLGRCPGPGAPVLLHVPCPCPSLCHLVTVTASELLSLPLVAMAPRPVPAVHPPSENHTQGTWSGPCPPTFPPQPWWPWPGHFSVLGPPGRRPRRGPDFTAKSHRGPHGFQKGLGTPCPVSPRSAQPCALPGRLSTGVTVLQSPAGTRDVTVLQMSKLRPGHRSPGHRTGAARQTQGRPGRGRVGPARPLIGQEATRRPS
jgi:hypothetical protein